MMIHMCSEVHNWGIQMSMSNQIAVLKKPPKDRDIVDYRTNDILQPEVCEDRQCQAMLTVFLAVLCLPPAKIIALSHVPMALVS